MLAIVRELPDPDRQYELLLESNSQPVWIFDEETLRFLAVNDAAVRMYGYSREEYLAMRIVDIRAEEEIPRLLASIPHPVEASGPWTHRKKDGSLLTVEVWTDRMRFRDRPAQLVRVHDITAQARIRAELAQREAYFRALIENALDAITIIDDRGRVKYESPGAERVLGYAAEELVGTQGFDLVHPDDLPGVIRQLETSLASGAPTSRIEARFRHKNGDWRILEGISHNHLDDPAIRGIVINSRDITDQRNFEQALQKSERRSQMAQRAGRGRNVGARIRNRAYRHLRRHVGAIRAN